jgi:hypothetical protein
LYYLTHFLHWFAALLGICAYMIVFAMMPGLLNMGSPEHVRTVLFDLPLSIGVVHGFPPAWQIGFLLVGAALFVWISFMFLMSTHNLLVGVVGAVTQDRNDGVRAAWIATGTVLVLLAAAFAWVMFGSLWTLGALGYTPILCGVTGWLLYRNYAEIVDL